MLWSYLRANRYFLYRPVTDMRKGFNGLSGLVCNELGHDPLSGDAFLFMNRKRDRLKVLVWEGDGYAIYYKRLESGTYELPESQSDSLQLKADELQLLLSGIQLCSVKRRKRYAI